MAGFRDFQTGEVLTAANVNDFLAKQSVMKFADATARDTALGTAVGGGNALREGMVAYLDSTDEVLAYDGTAWGSLGLPLGTATPTDGQILAFGTATSTWNPTDGGKLVNVATATTNSGFTSTAGGAPNDITKGIEILSLSYTPAAATNTLICATNTIALYEPSNTGDFQWVALWNGATFVASSSGMVNPTTWGTNLSGAYTSINYAFTAGSTSTRTISVRAGIDIGTTIVNSGRTATDERLLTLTVFEVAA